MFRSALLLLTGSTAARSFLTGFPGSRSVVRRFVAGERLEDALRVIGELADCGIFVTADHLGENTSSPAEAVRAADATIDLLDAMDGSGRIAHVSIKLSQFGLDLGDEVCLPHLRRVVERARQIGTFVRVDMESTAYTDRTLSAVRTMKREGYANVGAVLQAYLRRTAGDVAALCEEGIRVRLCKGAYQEPPDKAFPEKKDVDRNYVEQAGFLLGASQRVPGLYPALATHDEKMIAAAKAYAKEHAISASAFEFQMLYGIRRDLQESLAKEGFNVRVYVPYGTQWYPYFVRRLAERPANLWFLASNVFRG